MAVLIKQGRSQKFQAILLVISLAVAFVDYSWGLDPAKKLRQYVHQAWTVREGLPGNSVIDIAQTSDGYLWIATGTGLARFDGTQFEIFSKPSGTLPSSYVTRLAADTDGSLWIGTAGGLVHWHDDKFEVTGREAGLDAEPITDLVADHQGRIWIVSKGKLWRYHSGLFSELDPAKDFGSTAMLFGIAVDRADNVWGVLKGGIVCQLRNDRFEAVPELPEMKGQALAFISAVRDGSVWVANWNGDVYRYLDGAWTRFGPKEGLSGIVTAHAILDRDGNVWLASLAGAARINGSNCTFFAGDNRDIPDQLLVAYEDREGNLWFGSGSQGLHRFTDASFTQLASEQGLPGGVINAICEDTDHNIWAATNTGIYRGRTQFALMYPAERFQGSLSRVELAADPRDGSLWIGTSTGLYRRNGDSLVRYSQKDGLPSDEVFALCLDHHGVLWIGCGSGLTCFDNGKFFLPPACPSATSIMTLTEDREGGMWIGTILGLMRYRDGELKRFGRTEGLGSELCVSARVDSKGCVWISTLNGGLSRYKGNRFFTYTQNDGLPGETIDSIIEDPVRGDLWLNGDKLFRISEKQLDDFQSGAIKHLFGTTFDFNDGIKSDINANCPEHVLRTEDGKLWWATGQGIAVVDPNRLILHNAAGPVVIKSLIADDRPVAKQNAKLRAGTRRLQIQYAALTFSAPEKVRFRYRLDGMDREWFDAGQRREALYTELHHGNYRFLVEASGDGGASWSGAVAELPLYVRPHFFETWWFLALCVGGCGALIWAGFLLRRHQLEARFRAVLAERVRVAGDIHDSLAQGFTAAATLLDGLEGQNDPRLKSRLRPVRVILGSSLADARSMIAVLRGQSSGHDSLGAGLRKLAEQLSVASPAQILLDCKEEELPLISIPVEVELLRICQEGINNAIRHADAKHIWVKLFVDDRKILRLTIRDDGKGFDVEHVVSSSPDPHFGIISLTERSKRIGGDLRIRSQAAKGTEVEVVLSLDPRDSRSLTRGYFL